ncbi:MAG: hypothetical protein U1D97_15745 [Desulfuromonadales bacterium]|nr:hypothetical protein [Desulfuromonadales bacterium]
MNESERKRDAAIMGAIAAYRAEEKIFSEGEESPSTCVPLLLPPNLWGLASRQDRMNQRQFWELRRR